MGWYWTPSSIWGPAWVSWAVGGGYVGWCPLGVHNRPVAPWHDRGHAVPRGRYGRWDPWNVVRRSDLGGRDLGRRRVSPGQIDAGALRVADTPELRPTRDGGNLREGGAAPRAITRRMSPGDFVRELGPDNKTTIPAPWTRGYGPPPAGVEGARYGVPRRTDDQGGDDKPARNWTTNRGTGGVAAPTTGAPTASSGQPDDRAASSPRRAPRPAPWYTPSSPQSGSSDRGERTAPTSGGVARPRSGGDGHVLNRPAEGDASRSRSGSGESSGGYRPRSSGSGGSGGYRPGSGSGGQGSGTNRAPSSGGSSGGGAYRPRGSGGGQSSGTTRAPSSSGSSGGAARGRSSGGSSGSSGGSSGGGHSAARPRGSRN
jgi:translation initiation factor IF-2